MKYIVWIVVLIFLSAGVTIIMEYLAGLIFGIVIGKRRKRKKGKERRHKKHNLVV